MKKVIMIMSIIVCCVSTTSLAEEVKRKINPFHHKLTIKNRARTRALTQQGRVMYQYTDVRETVEGQAGNILAESSVKKIYNYTALKDTLTKETENAVKIGNVTAEGSTTDIVNIVEIEGDIETAAQSVEIGNITLENGGSGQIENVVKITGNIYVE